MTSRGIVIEILGLDTRDRFCCFLPHTNHILYKTYLCLDIPSWHNFPRGAPLVIECGSVSWEQTLFRFIISGRQYQHLFSLNCRCSFSPISIVGNCFCWRPLHLGLPILRQFQIYVPVTLIFRLTALSFFFSFFDIFSFEGLGFKNQGNL